MNPAQISLWKTTVTVYIYIYVYIYITKKIITRRRIYVENWLPTQIALHLFWWIFSGELVNGHDLFSRSGQPTIHGTKNWQRHVPSAALAPEALRIDASTSPSLDVLHSAVPPVHVLMGCCHCSCVSPNFKKRNATKRVLPPKELTAGTWKSSLWKGRSFSKPPLWFQVPAVRFLPECRHLFACLNIVWVYDIP